MTLLNAVAFTWAVLIVAAFWAGNRILNAKSGMPELDPRKHKKM